MIKHANIKVLTHDFSVRIMFMVTTYNSNNKRTNTDDNYKGRNDNFNNNDDNNVNDKSIIQWLGYNYCTNYKKRKQST